eukprot:6173153-Pleurochrysis_carterae.AAC.2
MCFFGSRVFPLRDLADHGQVQPAASAPRRAADDTVRHHRRRLHGGRHDRLVHPPLGQVVPRRGGRRALKTRRVASAES